MFFDALTTAAMVDELRSTLVGGRVQDVVLVDRLSLALEIYAGRQRHYLLLSAETEHPRVHRAAAKPRRGPEKPVPLLLQLRKYVRGARLRGVTQPAFERILCLDFEGAEDAVTLVVEIMGRHSNIILRAADGTIMEAIKRVFPEQSRRPVLPKYPYEPPPPLPKASLASLTPPRLRALLAEGEGPLWRRLVGAVAGMSPLLAREIVYRASGDAAALEAQPADLLAIGRALLIDLPRTHAWTPTVGLEAGVAIAYAPYALTHLPEQRPETTISEAIEGYLAAREAGLPYAAAKAAVHRLLAEAREREERRRAAIARDLRSEEEIQRLRQSGEWILACATMIGRGQSELVVEGADGRPLTIALDPARTPVENAQRYFREYEDARAAASRGPERLAEVDRALARLAQWATDLDLAENRAEIEEVRAALAEAGYLRAQGRIAAPRSAGPRRLETGEGFVVWVGRNSRQNAIVLERAAPHDLWFHARGVPGGHVILVTGGRKVPPELVERVAALAAYYSAAREEKRAPVDVTERRHVRPIRNAGPGQVTYRQEQTLVVTPKPSLDEAM